MRPLALQRTMAALLFLVVLGAGCRVPIGVKRVGYEPVYRELTSNAINSERPSGITTQILYFFSLDERFEKDPEGTLEALQAEAVAEERRIALFALAELSYLTARRLESRRHYLASAVYAYLFLFDEGDEPLPSPFDPEFRVACDLYNRGLAQALIEDGEIVLTSGERALPVGTLAIEAARLGFPWGEEYYDHFLPADEFAVRGLAARVRRSGLGVPVIAAHSSPPDRDQPTYERKGANVPASVFLRIEGDLGDLAAGHLSGTLELHSGFEDPVVQIGEQSVPVESDLTTALAYEIEENPIWWKIGLLAFFSGEGGKLENGLYMAQPYEPDKVPVVFVHGTASSPARWAPMFNGLRWDALLRREYQFWFFLYSTGNPIVYSAAELRRNLREAVAAVDPAGEDPALREMVVIGHSQGGLLAKLTVVDSQDRFWASISDTDFEALTMEAEQKELLRRCLFVDPLPFVRRVVYISTPHQGSYVAGGWVGRFAKRLVRTKNEVLSTVQGLFDSGALPPELTENIPTSIDNMQRGNSFLTALGNLRPAPGVTTHSIISVKGRGPPEKGNDGVVEYTSAHVEDAESELVVRDAHSCQANPLTIGEVRRILLEHIAQARAAGALVPSE